MTKTKPTLTTLALDAARSTIAFSAWAPPPFGPGNGRFTRARGSLTSTGDRPVRAEGSIEVASLTSAVAMRDRHLLSNDFLHADAHPTIAFATDRITHTGGDTYRVDGRLTIRGVTRPLTGEATATPAAGGVVIRARTEIDRRTFGVQKNRFDVAMAGRTVHIELELHAVTATEADGGAR